MEFSGSTAGAAGCEVRLPVACPQKDLVVEPRSSGKANEEQTSLLLCYWCLCRAWGCRLVTQATLRSCSHLSAGRVTDHVRPSGGSCLSCSYVMPLWKIRSLVWACNQPENLLEEVTDDYLELHRKTPTVSFVPSLAFLKTVR
ncbi:hypothetical protein VULLAG_LOCUS16266 [Vulpes lagopus]